MGIFKVLELEDAVQTSDRTRFSASKSYISKGAVAITKVEVQPGLDGAFVDVFLINKPEEWYYDWQFDSWTFDIIAGFNDQISFREGQIELIATLTPGTYASLAALAAEIQTQLLATGTATYTVAVDNKKQKLTISSDGTFELMGRTSSSISSILPHLGYSKDTGFGGNQISKPVEYSHKAIALKVTAGTIEAKNYVIKLFNEYGDRLFSNDQDLVKEEKDILKWCVKGRNSFKDIHRRVQFEILEFLNGKGYVDVFQDIFTKWSFEDLDQLNDWSLFLALTYIFNDASNQSDDIWAKKASAYKSMSTEARNKFIRLDIDSDGVIDVDEYLRIGVGSIFLR